MRMEKKEYRGKKYYEHEGRVWEDQENGELKELSTPTNTGEGRSRMYYANFARIKGKLYLDVSSIRETSSGVPFKHNFEKHQFRMTYTLPTPPSEECCDDDCRYTDGLCDKHGTGNLPPSPSPEQYVQKLVEVFREVRRVLRDDGTLWLNLEEWEKEYRALFEPDGNTINKIIERRGIYDCGKCFIEDEEREYLQPTINFIRTLLTSRDTYWKARVRKEVEKWADQYTNPSISAIEKAYKRAELVTQIKTELLQALDNLK